MKYGICLTPIYPQAISDYKLMEGLLEKIVCQKFIDCIEIYFEGSKEEQILFRNSIKNKSLEAVYLGGLPIKRDSIDISAEDEGIRRKSVDMCKEHIDRALNMGCKKIVVASGQNWEKSGCRELIVQKMQKSLSELDDYCKGIEFQISVEPFPVKTEPYLAVGDIGLVYEIFQTSAFHNVGITFDTSHISQLGADLDKSFELLMPWIRHVHLANCVMKDKKSPLYGDKHPVFIQEGGDFSLEVIRRFFREKILSQKPEKIDICSLEVISRGNENWYYDEICREAKEIWQS